MRKRFIKKELDWHLEDFECRLGFKGGKYTDVLLLPAFLATVVLAGAFFTIMCYLPVDYRKHQVFAMIMERGWTPYAMVGLFILAMVILFVKSRKLAFQQRAFKVEIIPVGDSFALTKTTALEVLKNIYEAVDDPKRFVLLNRIERALLNLKNVGNLSDVSEMLRAQAENDESHTESSYNLLGGIIWALPIFGFIGTVIGLSSAIGGFGAVLNSETNIASLRESLGGVTGSLGVAFDTTFLALVMAVIIQMTMTLLRKKEELFMDDCREYAHVKIISRLRIE